MGRLSVDELLEGIKELSVIEAADLAKRMQEEFGIQAAAPMQAAAPGGGGAATEAAAEEEKDEFDVLITAIGGQKIQVIKEVRALTGLGLKEAKDLVDSADKAPAMVKEKVSKDEASKIKETIEGAGATVQVR